MLPRLARCSFKSRQWQRRQCRPLVTLAIETSCDDTCVAVLEYNGDDNNNNRHGSSPASGAATAARLHFHEKITAPNTGKGGIVPIEASTSHRTNLAKLVQKALKSRPPSRPDFISVTRGPGMYSNLSCGLDTAKGLATAFDIPMIGVHHMQAHALTPRLIHALQPAKKQEQVGQGNPTTLEPSFPFLTLLVSGGHTMLLRSDSLTKHAILADTVDIAIGDCLDKCGRAILPESIRKNTVDTAYGKYLSKYAFPDSSTFTSSSSSYPIPARRLDEIDKPLNEYGWRIPLPLRETRTLAFSYAGIGSHVQRIVNRLPADDENQRLALARMALGAAFEHLCSRVIIALENIRSTAASNGSSSVTGDIKTLVVSGGVAANDFLRYFLRGMLDVRGFRDVELVFPPIRATFPNTTSNNSGNSGENSDNDNKEANQGQIILEPCTDNAAMIAWAGMEMYLAGWYSDLGINAIPRWSLDDGIDGGGIAGYTSRH